MKKSIKAIAAENSSSPIATNHSRLASHWRRVGKMGVHVIVELVYVRKGAHA